MIDGEIARRCLDKNNRLDIPKNESKLAADVLQWLTNKKLAEPAHSELRNAVRVVCAASG